MAGPLDSLIHGYRFVYKGVTSLFQRKSLIFDPDVFSVTDDPDVIAGDPEEPTAGATRVGILNSALGSEGQYLTITTTPTSDLDVSGVGTLSSASSDASTEVHGMLPPPPGKSQRIAIVNNNGDSASFTLFYDDAVVDGAGLMTPGAVDLSVDPNHVYWAVYDHDTSAWIVSLALPATSDDGDVLTVVDGAWQSAPIPRQIPAPTTNGDVLTVVDGAWAGVTKPDLAVEWRKALDLDFRLQANQTLATDGTYTIGGLTWNKRNSANDRVSMAVVNGTGLVIKPGATGNWGGGAYTAPLIDIPMSSISAGLAFGRPVRITIYLSAETGSGNFDFAVFGISSQSGVAGYLGVAGFLGTENVQVEVIGGSSASSASNNATLGSTNDIMRLLIPCVGQPNAMVLTAAHGAGGTEIPDEHLFDIQPYVNSTSLVMTGLTRTNASLAIAALRNGGTDTTFAVTIARVTVEYFGPPSIDGSGIPGASLTGLSWRLPFIADLGSTYMGIENYSCPATSESIAVMSGAPGVEYDVTLNFVGAVEMKSYTGGTNDGAHWQVGGTPASDAGVNVYKLEISSPAQTYYLNRDSGAGVAPAAINFSKTVQITTGATVTLTADSINAAELYQNLTVSGVTDPAQPYDGQFINMTVTTIAPH